MTMDNCFLLWEEAINQKNKMENLKEHNMDSKKEQLEQLELAKQLANRRRDRLRRLHTESELLQFIAELLISIEHRINNILTFQK